MLKNLIVVLHVITAAGWFGLAVAMVSISRKAAEGADAALAEIGNRAMFLMNGFISVTFVLGLIAFFMGGGFAFYGPQFHSSITLVLIMVAIQFLMLRPAWRTLISGPDRDSARKKMAMGTGINHLIWLVVLVLMFWNHFPLF